MYNDFCGNRYYYNPYYPYNTLEEKRKFLEAYKECVDILVAINSVFPENEGKIFNLISKLYVEPINKNIIVRYNEKTIYESSNDPKSARYGLKSFYMELEKAFLEDWLGSGYGRKFASISFNDNEVVTDPLPQLVKIKLDTDTDSIIFNIETAKDFGNEIE